MLNQYVDEHGTRITSYSFIKEITYPKESRAIQIEEKLLKLKTAKFDFINIPYFEFQRDGANMRIESEFIKGWYCFDIHSIYNDLISKDWTFYDPHPSNFITCKKTEKTYAVDLESFAYIPNIDDRKKLWLRYQNLWPVWPMKTYVFDEHGMWTQKY